MRMGLVARQLFCRPERRGVMLRWHAGVGREQLAEAIETSADDLGLRERAAPSRDEPNSANPQGAQGDEEGGPPAD
jgi:hypothetical protein